MAIKEVKYTAIIIESERGWGRKIDEVKEFDTEKERDDFVKKFNSKNPPGPAPDWYMIAEKGDDVIKDADAETIRKAGALIPKEEFHTVVDTKKIDLINGVIPDVEEQ
jgi:hypothetical protein